MNLAKAAVIVPAFRKKGRKKLDYLLRSGNKCETKQKTKSRSFKFLVSLLMKNLPLIFIKKHYRISPFFICAVVFFTKQISKSNPEMAAFQCYVKQILQLKQLIRQKKAVSS